MRSRRTPKSEQVLILKFIFNIGMVNPPKDETVRIIKLLEQLCSIGNERFLLEPTLKILLAIANNTRCKLYSCKKALMKNDRFVIWFLKIEMR